MKKRETRLPGVVLIELEQFGDERGFFMEIYHSEKYRQLGIEQAFVQDNLSRSQRGVLRGLHYQIQHAQGKLVTVAAGEIFDVAVDLRRSSPHFGHWFGSCLSSQNRHALYIPPGFAHGFYVLSETADVLYKCTDLYFPEHERTVFWNDPELAIDWPLTGPPIVSEKDQRGTLLREAECFEHDHFE